MKELQVARGCDLPEGQRAEWMKAAPVEQPALDQALRRPLAEESLAARFSVESSMLALAHQQRRDLAWFRPVTTKRLSAIGLIGSQG